MSVIQFAINNPVKVAVGVILAVLFGAIAYFGTPVRLTPDVEEPEITVTTKWRGASAKEVEEQIVEQQEEYLKSVEGLREFKSSSVDATATITLKFAVGTDLGTAAANVRDKLNQVPSYPERVDRPVITTVNPNANAIAWFMLKPLPPTKDDLQAFADGHPELRSLLAPMLEGKEKIDLAMLAKWSTTHPQLKALTTGKDEPAKLRKFAEDNIEARFERVKGIANANVLGGQEQEFRIIVDPHKLAANNLTITDLRNAIRSANRNTSGGDIREGKSKNVVRTIGLFDSPEKVANTVVAIRDNTPVKIQDVARVAVAYNKPEGVVRQSGVDSLAVNAQQAPGSNLIEVMGPPLEKFDLDGDGEISQTELAQSKQIYGDSLRLAVAELNSGILKQRGLHLEQVYDQTEYLNSAKQLVEGNIYLGGTLAILVLLLFLRSPRSVLIIGLSIPISVVATFIFVRGFGRTINVISLAGMAFAVGMVVDNAIVVLENIYRHYQMGEDPDTAASRGTQEVWGAVLASTLTTLAVFIPVLFVQGQAGQLFRDIAIAISCAVGLSLIVSVTVIPTAAKRVLKKRTGLEPQRASRVPGRLRQFLNFGRHFTNGVCGIVHKLQTMPFNVPVRLLVIVLFVTASIAGAYYLAPKTEYLPDGNRNLVVAALMPPPGYSVEKMIRLGEEEVEPKVAPYWEAKPGSPEEKALKGPRIKNFFFVARGNRLFMGARAEDPLRAGELVPFMNETVRGVPGVFAFASQASLFESALTGGRTIDIEITGPDLKTLVEQGRIAMGMCLQQFPLEEGNQIQPIPGLDLTSPEVHVVSKKEKAAEVKITDDDLGYAVDALVDGAFAGEYWHEGRKIDLIIFGSEEFARHTHDLKDLPIATPTGKVVSVGSIADVTLSNGPNEIDHSERLRTITLRLKPAPNIPLETALETVNEKIRKPLLETSAFEGGTYQIRLAGTADKLAETRRDVQWNLVLALLITYLLMAALFESFFYPLISMTSVVLALVGGFAGLYVLNLFIPQKLDMLTMLGFVILIGTVVNNAILIVHQALNHMREDAMTPKDAVVESVRTRVRPIFMTTVTTVLGMLPLVVPIPTWTDGGVRFVPGAGSELYRGLGSVVLGGLIVSTLFTLVLIPTAFSLAVDLKVALAKLFRFHPGAELQPAAISAPLPGQSGTIAVDTPLGLRDVPLVRPEPVGTADVAEAASFRTDAGSVGYDSADGNGNGDGAATTHTAAGASPVAAPRSPK
jgi:hydrophobic/amphiphilic exporter-1 (mainly G- bacteria), HAE1 family